MLRLIGISKAIVSIHTLRRPSLIGYSASMDDQSILTRIEELVHEEHSLQGQEVGDADRGDVLDDDRRRLEAVSVELDRCWDLLRQRRARRSAGQDPDEAHARDSDTVEKYWQ
jgi:hypothetical protein